MPDDAQTPPSRACAELRVERYALSEKGTVDDALNLTEIYRAVTQLLDSGWTLPEIKRLSKFGNRFQQAGEDLVVLTVDIRYLEFIRWLVQADRITKTPPADALAFMHGEEAGVPFGPDGGPFPVSCPTVRRCPYEQSQTRLLLSVLSNGGAETAACPDVWLCLVRVQLGIGAAPADLPGNGPRTLLYGVRCADDRTQTPGGNQFSLGGVLRAFATERTPSHAGLYELLRGTRRVSHIQEAAGGTVGHVYALGLLLQKRGVDSCKNG